MNKDNIAVLLVDDEEALLTSLQRRLQLRGFNVFVANRGEEALGLAREENIDVAVLDVKMPGMDGRELLLALKQEHPDMQIIIQTGHGTFDPGDPEIADKIFSCLAKPCDFSLLKQTIVNAYTNKSSSSSSGSFES
ncbi:response regulator [Desulfonatronovibrio magnus]|uniref:response regulator n=1 Tax=Desulfonatronovibrio magnus TaxID=698827 RepID=UPI0005EB60F6|nr:response regulator [Desulfonatronovibrio magnus]